ncbi:MAG: orotate phosphoribosyltransferase [Gammaproteobacteria bacterium]
MTIHELVEELYKISAIKLGEFKLKSGEISPIYMDLRGIVSHPNILKTIVELLWKKIEGGKCDVICGVPYTALPIATGISLQYDIPMLVQRKEVKDYGTKKRIEGHFSKNDVCLIIEDVITTGGSVLTTKSYLEEEGLVVKHVCVIVDRQQGGKENLEKHDMQVISLFTLSECIQILKNSSVVDEAVKGRLKSMTITPIQQA